MSLHIMAAWYFDVYIIFWSLFLLLETGSEASFLKLVIMWNVWTIISLFQNSVHLHTDT